MAEKIIQRFPENHSEDGIYLYEKNEVDEDDLYKDFHIPDDLDW